MVGHRAHKAGLRRRVVSVVTKLPVRANRIRALFTLRNPEVVGSNPTLASKFLDHNFFTKTMLKMAPSTLSVQKCMDG